MCVIAIVISGRASITKFSVNCSGWKEWKSLDPNAVLKYSYFTKQPSSSREFPFAFGLGMKITERTVFPVGEFNKDFQLDVVIYIYDSVNDPLRFESPCKVRKYFIVFKGVTTKLVNMERLVMYSVKIQSLLLNCEISNISINDKNTRSFMTHCGMQYAF